MTTAFQPSAFQNNAFQIDARDPFGGGGFNKHSYKKFLEIRRKRKALKRLPEKIEMALLSATEKERKRIENYIAPFVRNEDQEIERMRVNYAQIILHERRLQAINAEIGKILARERELKRAAQEEELILLLLMVE